MVRTLAGLTAAGLLLADIGAARGQHWGGFGSHGRHVAVGGFWVGSGWGPVGPWGWSPPLVRAAPPILVIVTPPPVVIVRPAPDDGVALAGWLKRFEPEPLPNPAADANLDAAVKRGDLLVVRPRKDADRMAAVPPAAPVPPAPPLPAPLVPLRVPQDFKDRAAFEVALARRAFAAGEYGRAAERLAEAIRATPTDPLPYFLLAQARTAREEYVEAVAAVRDGLARDPDWPASGYNLRELYAADPARFDEHLAELKRAAAADPSDPTVGFLLGCHLWFLGDRAAAVELFRKAARRVRDAGAIEPFLAEVEGRKV